MSLEFLAWNSPPLDFSRIAVKVILINITLILIIIVIMIINNNNNSSNNIIIVLIINICSVNINITSIN